MNCKKTKDNYKHLLYFFLLCFLGIALFSINVEAAKGCKSMISYPGKTTSKVNIRQKASTRYKSYGFVSKNEPVVILGYTTNDGMKWYKCRTKVNGKTKTGYISAYYISIKYKPKAVVNSKVKTTVNLRKSPSSSSKCIAKLKRNTKVKVYGIRKTSGTYWYKIGVRYKKKYRKGYVSAKYLTVEMKKSSHTTTQKDDKVVQTEEQFEASMSVFPESYKVALRSLHATYPNWRFVGIQTNLDWNTVIANENVVGRNTIQSNYPKNVAFLAPFSYLSTQKGAYDWSKDKYFVKDGSNWYTANEAVISHYMDPRNFLNDKDIFQFEALAYDSSQKETVVQAILNGTFMQGNYSVKDIATNKTVSGSYKNAFMDAGRGALANPYFLSVRSKQEVGTNGSASTSGTYRGYAGYYNYYNIGAFDGKDAVAKGLAWAKGGNTNATTYGRPWTTPYKAIVGGAQFIAKNYINIGQNTLYLQKFNVAPIDKEQLFAHQYMTNVQAPYSEGRYTRDGYNQMGILSDNMVFYIPIYNNMPEKAAPLPKVAGNPNPYLSNITVKSGNNNLVLTPTFSIPTEDGTLQNATYSLVVPNSVQEVVIQATTISKYATVSGTGTFRLDVVDQPISFQIVGTAQNGAQQVYTVNITRSSK